MTVPRSTGSPPGLSAERTRLAWRRTTLTAVVVILLAASRAVADGIRPVEVIALCLMALTWLATLIVAQRRINTLSRTSPGVLAGRGPVHLALLVVLLALLGLILVPLPAFT